MERRNDQVCALSEPPLAPLTLLCSDRRRLTLLRKHLTPSLNLSTAASGEAMLPQLRHASGSVLAAVDINFIRDYGVRCLAWCDASPNVAGLVIFGAPHSYDPAIAAIYRYPCNNIIFGYKPSDLLQALQLVWTDFCRLEESAEYDAALAAV